MRLKGKLWILLVSILVLVFAIVEATHWVRFGHFAPLGLHADVLVRKADYGIPGISKVYEPRLTNFGVLPVRISVCDFVSDAFSSHGTLVGSSAEKWDPIGKQWRSLFPVGDDSGCRPTPLSMAEAHLASKELWPGQSVSGAEGAYAAFDRLAIGDKVRFVILPGNGRMIPTVAFPIDEHRSVVTTK